MLNVKKQLLMWSLALYSALVGCNITEDTNIVGTPSITTEEEEEKDYTPANIPEGYYNSDLDENTTVGDLESMYSVELFPKNISSVSWLEHCKNIMTLNIDLSSCSYEDWDQIVCDLDKIDFANFDKLEAVYVNTYFDGVANTFNEENFGFLKKSPNLKKISILSNWIDTEFLESFTNIEELCLYSSCINLNIDYSKFPNLKKLDLSEFEPYTLAVEITSSDLEYFDNRGIEVVLDDEEYRSKIIEINNKLDSILDQININSNDTDTEKLRKISLYIIDKLEYDFDVAMCLEDGMDISADYFYQDGFLYGALEEKSQVCGNYSALLHALGKRVGLDIYDVASFDHAWNMIKIDDKYYVVDLTYIDSDYSAEERLINNDINSLDYYLKTLDDESEFDLGHLTLDVPEEVIKENKTYEKKYKEVFSKNSE